MARPAPNLSGLSQKAPLAETGRETGPHPSGGGHRRMAGLDRAAAFEWRDGSRSKPANDAFRTGNKPVIRWIKANGLDDVITRSAIAQATRLFGNRVDYCLCTAGLAASRVRDILAWAAMPVHWWPLDSVDNAELATVLMAAGCAPERFGYWWKWFPERVRPEAPEWILDGDMVITDRPDWFEDWCRGLDRLRVSGSDPLEPLRRRAYGEYEDLVDPATHIYSGLISLPPGQRYLPALIDILRQQPLRAGHDGRRNLSEQGVIAATFSRLDAVPIPLADFPFGRAFEEHLDFGFPQVPGRVWGYHFGHAFRRENHHFVRLVDEHVIDWMEVEPGSIAKYRWLRNFGQWGWAGLSMQPTCVQRIVALCQTRRGQAVLELGTSRGFLTAIIADQGCPVTTIDLEDRGAASNLAGLPAIPLTTDAADFLKQSCSLYGLIIVDLPGNDSEAWQARWPLLAARVAPGGAMVLYNSHLWMVPEWQGETGLAWLLETIPEGFSKEVFAEPLPGMIVLTRAGAMDRPIAAPTRSPLQAAIEKRPAQAVERLKAALRKWPEDARLYDVLCRAYEDLGDPESALEAARRTVALAPHQAAHRGRLARLLLSQGHLPEAEAESRLFLEIEPEHPGARHRLSQILNRLDRREEALLEAREAVRLKPDGLGFVLHLANLALRLNHIDEAEAEARRAISLNGNLAAPHRLLSRILLQRGDPRAAIAAAEAALRRDPGDSASRDWLTRLQRLAEIPAHSPSTAAQPPIG